MPRASSPADPPHQRPGEAALECREHAFRNRATGGTPATTGGTRTIGRKVTIEVPHGLLRELQYPAEDCGDVRILVCPLDRLVRKRAPNPHFLLEEEHEPGGHAVAHPEVLLHEQGLGEVRRRAAKRALKRCYQFCPKPPNSLIYLTFD